MEKTDTQAVRPVDVINDLYETECAMDKAWAVAEALRCLFFEPSYDERYYTGELGKHHHEYVSNLFFVLTDQLFSLKEELDKVSTKYEVMH